MIDEDATARARRQYDAYASHYDHETGWWERAMLGDGRSWACSQARGDVLEVAMGTGRNLPHYPPDIRLTGIDLSPAMLALARLRAHQTGVAVNLVEGDAQALPLPDQRFDTVICTLGLSSIPDDRAALMQMHRVLRDDGRLVLLGHVASGYGLVRTAQGVLERVAAHRAQDAQTRRTVPLVRAVGFVILYRAVSRGGVVERLTAAKHLSAT